MRVFRILTIACVVLSACPAWSADAEFCRHYTEDAIKKYENGIRKGCQDLNFPVWSEDYNHHYNWCLTATETEVNQGKAYRDQQFEQCQGQEALGKIVESVTETALGTVAKYAHEKPCRDYATKSVTQQHKNIEQGCGLSGPEWNPKYDDHYNWCIHGENHTFSKTALQQRERLLLQCTTKQPLPSVKEVTPSFSKQNKARLDNAFVKAVNAATVEQNKKIRDAQEGVWNSSRDMILGRFNEEVKAASYDQRKTLPGLPGRPEIVKPTPGIIGEIDKQTGEVKIGGARPKAEQVCDGVAYYGAPRIVRILTSTKIDTLHVTPGDKVIIFGENFYNTKGRVDISLPLQNGNMLNIPLAAGNMNNWARSWLDQIIVVDVPNLNGLYETYNAQLRLMLTHPCRGQMHASYPIKLTPRMVVQQISGEDFFKLSGAGEDEDKAVSTMFEHKEYLKISHYPGCGIKIPIIGAWTGSGEEGDDYFFRHYKLPSLFTLQKAYIVPKFPGKDWGGVFSRISKDAIDVAINIASGDLAGAAISLVGHGIEGLIKWFDPSVGKYGLWIEEYPPQWAHYRLHWNNTCYTKSPRFRQVLEYATSFLVVGPDSLDPKPGWKNTSGVAGVAIAQ